MDGAAAGTILLLGAGPRAEAARALLHQAFPGARLADVVPSREALAEGSAAPPAWFVLVDPVPFGGVPTGELSADLLRAEALRAVFALELARRAARTLVLDGDAAGWPAVLQRAQPGLPADLALHDGPAAPVSLVEGASPVRTYLAPLWRAAAPGRAPALVWARDAFLDGDAPGEVLPELIEVAGRARIVAYGPYLPLPAGAWKATAWLGFSPDIGRLPFILEVDSGGNVARGFFEAERGGFFSLELDFHVADPLHPLELRLITQDSALEGQAALIEVRLDPL
ncbi:MAG: hypothetical protein ACOY4R_31645 [Pseudomonadota bacterium]